jgi:hypothetical protein
MKITFQGNLFADAGYAAMCAAAKVSEPSQLDAAAIERAVSTLLRLMLNDAAFKARPVAGSKKDKTFVTSDMSVIFTNNSLYSNPSIKSAAIKQDRLRERIIEKRDRVLALLNGQADGASTRCFVDGQPACYRIGNDEFPLVDSKGKRNFHPGLGEGHSVGALTALALEFFPLSVLRTGVNSGFFWFVHTAYAPIAVACAELTIATMQKEASKPNKPAFGFFGEWDIGNRAPNTALVALIRELVAGDKHTAINWKALEKSGFPVTAYIFSNDSRSPSIEAHDLPHGLFAFFDFLKMRPEDLHRFSREVLNKEKLGFRAAKAMLQEHSMISMCLVRPKNADKETSGFLMGGWRAHAIYAAEVLGMSARFIRDVEAIASRIVDADNAKDLIFTLQSLLGRAALMRLCRKGVLDADELARLMPPDRAYAANAARDYLLGAIYEMQRAREKEEEFRNWEGADEPTPDVPGVVKLAQEIGTSIAADERATRYASDIARAGKTTALRGVMLRAIRQDLLEWTQFIQMFPPAAPYHSLLVRDYVLAYLYTALREQAETLPEPEIGDGKELTAVEKELEKQAA